MTFFLKTRKKSKNYYTKIKFFPRTDFGRRLPEPDAGLHSAHVRAPDGCPGPGPDVAPMLPGAHTAQLRALPGDLPHLPALRGAHLFAGGIFWIFNFITIFLFYLHF